MTTKKKPARKPVPKPEVMWMWRDDTIGNHLDGWTAAATRDSDKTLASVIQIDTEIVLSRRGWR